MSLLLLAGLAAAGEDLALHGNVKSFFVAGDSRPWFELSDSARATVEAMGLSEDEALAAYGLDAAPFAQGTTSARLTGMARWRVLRVDAHWAFAARSAAAATGLGGVATGVGLDAPELLPLTWTPDTGEALTVTHRVDRLVVSAALPHVDLALGRQAVSFGSGRFFTPLDLVNPFHPATIDTEYKPGVDALRADVYAGTAGRVTVVGAWAGDPIVGERARDPDVPVINDLVLAGTGQFLVGVTDLVGFVGLVHGEGVVGASSTSAIGPVGVHGDVTLSFPEDADPFVRVVIGADGRPTGTTSVSGEVYLQTFGATDPADYLAEAEAPRFTRGEVWQLGQWYAAVAVAQEVTPLVNLNLSAITNLRDPSALLVVGGAWSVADDAELGLGAYAGLGKAPDPVALDFGVDAAGTPTLLPPTTEALAASVNSEFGLYPAMGFVQVKVYF